MLIMTSGDPSSVANPSAFLTTHMTFDWSVNFDANTIDGHVILQFKRPNATDKALDLDINHLIIKSVEIANKEAPFEITPQRSTALGSQLRIHCADVGENFSVKITYKTAPKSSALQWLPAEQTADRRLPFLFSQCQAIHARSLFPCQDTPAVKSTFDATVRVPKDIVAVMGGIRLSKPCTQGDGLLQYRFEQTVPIPSYLVTIACGDLASRRIGPRSFVWAEPSVVERAAAEFIETEQMIAAGEALCGPYVWKRYDILVLPPTFPYGGMENPCLTFVSPTIIAGDRSLVNVIAHEIAHSWTGNLVTNSSWEHFWLNEGHTVYLERLIMEKLHGTDVRHLLLAIGYSELVITCSDLGAENPLSKLVLDLSDGRDPDDGYTLIPYEKGSLLLFFLEQTVGKDQMLTWLRAYLKQFSGVSLDTTKWRRFLVEQLGAKAEQIDWDHWLSGLGLPSWKPKFEAQNLIDQCERLIALMSSDTLSSSLSDLEQLWGLMSFIQRELSLRRLNECTVLSHENLRLVDSVLQLSKQQNAELRFEWSMMCVHSKYLEALPSCFEFLNSQGRMRYTRPLYKTLNKWSEIRNSVIDNFKSQLPFMHQTTAAVVKKELGL